jgi:DNA-binding MarR family transcriptional regulator
VSKPSGAETAQAVLVGYQRLRRRLREMSEPEGLTPSQRSVLSRLDRQPATASELAATERVRPQSMAAIVGGLEELGLVERKADPDDGRRRIVSLTRQGADWVRGNRRTKEGWLGDVLARECTVEERATLLAAMHVLERVTDA